MTSPADWDPALYERFIGERERPFYDLCTLVKPRPGMRVLDLGCGTGKLTRALVGQLGAASVVGIDSSETMLAEARKLAGEGLRFEHADITAYLASLAPGSVDLVLSNAALHFVPDHQALLATITEVLAPGGQMAIQMPRNVDHASYQVANELGAGSPFRDALGGYRHGDYVKPARFYAERLWELGYRRRYVAARIYIHEVEDREAALAWAEGGLLNAYRARLSADLFARFRAAYRDQLRARLPDRRPFPFSYERIFLWAQVAIR